MSFLPKDWTKFGEIYKNQEHNIYICTLCSDKALEFSHNFVFYDVISLIQHIEYKHGDRSKESEKLEDYLKKHTERINSKLIKTQNEEMLGEKKENAYRETSLLNGDVVKNFKIKQQWQRSYNDSVAIELPQGNPFQVRKLNIQCPYCFARLNTNFELLEHMKLHKEKETATMKTPDDMPSPEHDKPQRPYRCEQCFQDFSAPWQLKRHQNIHKTYPKTSKNMHAARPYQCRRCGKRTLSEKSLTLHQRRFHSGESLLETSKCPECGKLILEVNMRQHMLVHSNMRLYKCGLCSRTYRQRQSLTWHIKTKHATQLMDEDKESEETEPVETPATLANADKKKQKGTADMTPPEDASDNDL